MGRQCLHVCYDCLCLMVLFRDVMFMIGLRGLYGPGFNPGIAEQLPGN